MSTRKRLAIGSAVVVLLGLGAVAVILWSDTAPTLRLAPPNPPPTAESSTAPPITAPVASTQTGASTPPVPQSVPAATPSSLPASVSSGPAEVPWDQVEELSGHRPSASPWSDLAMGLNEQLRGAMQPCGEERARRFASGVVDRGQTPAMLKLLLEAPAPDRIVVTGVDRDWLGGSPSEYIRCVVRAVTGYETVAAGMPAGQRLKLLLQTY